VKTCIHVLIVGEVIHKRHQLNVLFVANNSQRFEILLYTEIISVSSSYLNSLTFSVFPSIAIYLLPKMISWNSTIWCLSVSEADSIGECGRLSQISSADVWSHYNMHILILTYLLCPGLHRWWCWLQGVMNRGAETESWRTSIG